MRVPLSRVRRKRVRQNWLYGEGPDARNRLRVGVSRGEGAKQPTHSAISAQPRADDTVLGLLLSCLQTWQ